MTDINVDELIAEARRAVKALGVRQSAMLIDRLADALELVHEVIAGAGEETHYAGCWRRHAGCLAARVRGMLTGEGA